MKKILLSVLIALFILPFVSAEITFSDDFYDKYNLGDVVDVQGYILVDSNIDDIFRLYLECGDNSQILSGRMIHVNKNENYYFNQEVNLPISNEGTCHFSAEFNDESSDSEDFTITDELKGDIFVTDNQIKLGESLNLEGDVYRFSNDRIDGFGILILSKDEEEFLVDTFEISNGDVAYSFILDSLPSGDYDLEIEVYDYYGNSHTFSFAQKIKIIDELNARLSLEQYEISQGDNLILNGEVDDSESYEVYIEYGDDSETLNFYSSSFEYELKLDTLQSGSHDLLVKIIDDFGNFHVESLGFNVVAVSDHMEASVGASALPGDSLSIEATVYDKAGYVYSDDISVKISKSRTEVSSFVLNSGEIFNYDIEDYTEPGTYVVEFDSTDFNLEKSFEIGELKEIDAYYEDNRLKIRNAGNVDLNDNFQVTIGNEVVDFNYNLKPSEIEDYDLRGSVEAGVYTALISSTYGEIQIDVEVVDDRSGFEKITGFVVGSNGGSSTLLAIILIVVVAVLVYLFFFRKKKVKINPKREVYQGDYSKDYEAGKATRKKLMNKRENMKKQPKRLFPHKEIPKEDADQFRESMVSKMKEK